MTSAKGASRGSSLEAERDDCSLNLDAVRASLEDAASVLAEMAEGGANAESAQR